MASEGKFSADFSIDKCYAFPQGAATVEMLAGEGKAGDLLKSK